VSHYYQKQSVYEWQLQNGNRVVWLNRPTSSGKIIFKAMTDIGYQTQQQPEWLASSALQLFEQSAPTGMDVKEWQAWQQQNNAKWQFKLHAQHLDLSLSTDKDSLDAALFSFWLNHQKRVFDKTALDAVSQPLALISDKDNPETLYELRYGNRNQKEKTAEGFKGLTSSTLTESAYRLMNQQHTMFIVGDINIDILKKSIGKYLSPLVNDKALTMRPVLQRTGHHHFVQQRKGNKKTRTVLYISNEMEWTPERAFMLSTLNPLIQQALRKKLRLELAGVYRVAFEMTLNPDTNQVETELSFISAPDRAKELITAALKVLKDLSPVVQSMNIPRVRTDIKFAEADRLHSSSTWLRRLMLSYRKYNDPRYLESMLRLTDELTYKKLLELGNLALPMQNQVLVEIQYSPNK